MVVLIWISIKTTTHQILSRQLQAGKKNSVGKYYQMKTSEKDLGNWTYSEITINDFHMSKYSYAKRETIIAHEILHALGLKDLYSQKNAFLIMYGYGSGIPSTGLNLSKLENDVIRAKY